MNYVRVLALAAACAALAPGCAVMLGSSGAGPQPLRVNSMFSNNMVLQRGTRIPVWGEGAPGRLVTATLAGRKRTAKVGGDGKWALRFGSMPAGGPHVLSVTDGCSTVEFRNVMIGDVWLCSGQSNMQLPVSEALDSGRELVTGNDFPSIRLYAISKWGGFAQQPQPEAGSAWVECSSQTLSTFSAVGYFFARELKTTTLKDVPIGLIDASRGATRIESWIDRATLAKHFAMSELRDSGFGATISSCYNGMISPVIPYAIRGVLWYQGASNASRPEQYRKLFHLLTKDWRARWGRKDLPFLFVQQPNFAEKFDGAYFTLIREAQLRCWQEIPRTGMAVTIDVGEPKNVHPRNKQAVGKRLALLARGLVYGERDLLYSGPIFRSMKTRGGEARLRFRFAEGLKDKNGGELEGFEIAGADGVYHEAAARIDGQTVVLSSDAVARPRAARYAWGPWPAADLVNAADLPASPFRTDRTQDEKH